MEPEVEQIAAARGRDLDLLAQQMFDFLAANIPEATTDEDVARLTLASCSSNIEALLSMLRNDIPASATEAPVTALEHARLMAARGMPVDATLRFYRLGHAFIWDVLSTELVEAIPDPVRLMTAMRETSTFLFGYVDVVSARVNDEHIAERDRRRRRAAIVREDVVRQLLAGEPLDRDRAERALGHRVSGPQLAFLCWTDGDASALERAALAVAEVAGGRPLLVPDGPLTLGGWLAATAAPEAAAVAAAAARAAPHVHVALGEIGDVRRSRQTAERARRMAELAGAAPPSCTRYADVALADLLTSDAGAARAFAAAELGALASDPELQATVLAVVAPGGSLAAAARALDLHRNTVLQRIKRAETLRGRPISDRPAELHAALVIVQSAHLGG